MTSNKQQENGIDCGLFSICYAVDLAFGYSPEHKNYDHQKLRSHLLSCLINGNFTTFPTMDGRMKNLCKPHIMFADIYCTCRSTFFDSDPQEDTGLFMVCCVDCDEWFHKRCEKVTAKIFKDDALSSMWKCSTCKC